MNCRAGFLAALLLPACLGAEAEASRAVREYDDALVRAYGRNDAALLAGLATPKEQARVQVLVDLKAGAKLALEARLESFEVASAKASGDGAVVETTERWRYHDRSLAPGRPDGPDFDSDMRMRYALVRDGGRWKVDAVSTVSAKPAAIPPR